MVMSEFDIYGDFNTRRSGVYQRHLLSFSRMVLYNLALSSNCLTQLVKVKAIKSRSDELKVDMCRNTLADYKPSQFCLDAHAP